MEPALVLFDIDGTLVDTAGAGRRAMETAFRQAFRIDGLDRVSRQVRFAGMSDLRIIETLVRALGIEDAEGHAFDTLRRHYLVALREEMARTDPRRRILPGVVELLRRLEAQEQVYLGLLTGNMEAGARTKLEPFDLNRYFPAGGFGSDHIDRREIARVARRKATEYFGVHFRDERVSVIGDTELDVDCALANGFRAVAVESGWVERQTLRAAGPHALFPDLTDAPAVLAAMGLAVDDEGDAGRANSRPPAQ